MELESRSLLWTLALVPPYVWLRLRQRRPPIAVVSSLMLWKAVPPPPREVLARRERLWNLVLLVEAVSLACVCLSLAVPKAIHTAPGPIHLVLGIDDSASMAAGDRWAEAERRMDGWLAQLQPSDEVTLLTNRGETPRLSLDSAREQIARRGPSPIEDDLDGLLARARAIGAGDSSAIVRVISDRPVRDAPEVESVGGLVDNAGIVDASVDANAIFVSVAATSPRRVSIEAVDDGRLLGKAEVDVVDAQPTPLTIPVKLTGAETIHVRSTAKDDLSLDDEVVFTPHPAATVRLDSTGNAKLLLALSVQPGAQVVQGDAGEADLVVLDRVWRDALPKAPCVIIAPPEGCPLRGDAVEGAIDTWEHVPLLDGLLPEAVGLKKAHSFRAPPGWTEGKTLAAVGGRAVLVSGRMAGRDLLYIGFDVSLEGGECTWATHPHFPVFWDHVLKLLAPSHEGWTRTSGLCSLKETLCSSVPTSGGPIDTLQRGVVSSARFFTADALIAAALGFSVAFLLSRRANGWPSSSSSTTR